MAEQQRRAEEQDRIDALTERNTEITERLAQLRDRGEVNRTAQQSTEERIAWAKQAAHRSHELAEKAHHHVSQAHHRAAEAHEQTARLKDTVADKLPDNSRTLRAEAAKHRQRAADDRAHAEEPQQR